MTEATTHTPAGASPAGLSRSRSVLVWALVVLAALIVWWRRFGEEPGGEALRLPASVALLAGLQVATIGYFFVLHELWAGMLLALSFGLHRPGKWVASLCVAALALAIREHALPFVLLMAALALWRRFPARPAC